jgi:phosphate uptake regulator
MKKVYRLQAIGGSLYVAVPKEWLRRFNLGKGSAVEVSIDPDGSLRILPLERGEQKELRKELEAEVLIERPGDVMASILTAYLRGYDTIIIRFSRGISEKEVKDAIERAKELMLGLEIVDSGSNYVVLKVLVSEDTPVFQLVQNMSKTVRFMYLDALRSLEQRDPELAKAVILRDRDVNRIYFYITRVIRKKMIEPITLDSAEALKLVDLRLLIKSIESIGDEAKNAASATLEILSKGLDIPMQEFSSVKEYTAKVDEVYKDVVLKAFEKELSIEDIRSKLSTCNLVRDLLKHLRIRIAEQIRIYWFAEFVKSYENIAMYVYDIVSLVSPEIQLHQLIFE